VGIGGWWGSREAAGGSATAVMARLTSYQQEWLNMLMKVCPNWPYFITLGYDPDFMNISSDWLFKKFVEWSKVCQPHLKGRFDWFVIEENQRGYQHFHGVLNCAASAFQDYLEEGWKLSRGGGNFQAKPINRTNGTLAYMLKDFGEHRFFIMSDGLQNDLRNTNRRSMNGH
jgi:hypothetical protein